MTVYYTSLHEITHMPADKRRLVVCTNGFINAAMCQNYVTGIYGTNKLLFHQGFPNWEDTNNLRPRVKRALEIWRMLRFRSGAMW